MPLLGRKGERGKAGKGDHLAFFSLSRFPPFLTFGAGIRYNIVGVDFSYVYALEENHPLANTMRFSLLLNFAK